MFFPLTDCFWQFQLNPGQLIPGQLCYKHHPSNYFSVDSIFAKKFANCTHLKILTAEHVKY